VSPRPFASDLPNSGLVDLQRTPLRGAGDVPAVTLGKSGLAGDERGARHSSTPYASVRTGGNPAHPRRRRPQDRARRLALTAHPTADS
jgi:hypothetical protein